MSSTKGTQPQGEGTLRKIAIAQPAAGAELTQTIPADVTWEFISLWANIASNGTTTTRRMALTISDGTDLCFHSSSQSLTNPNADHSVIFFNTGQLIGGVINVAPHCIPFPTGLLLPTGWIIASDTTGLQATDQIEDVFLLVIERLA